MTINKRPILSEPFNAKKLKKYRGRAAFILGTSMTLMIVLSLIPDIFELSEAADKALSEASRMAILPAIFSGAFLWFSTAWNILPLRGKKLAEMVELSKNDNQVLAYAQKIKAQGRDPVMEDLKRVRHYHQKKEEYNEHQAAAVTWNSLQT